MEDELPTITIKYIPNLENAINIFSKEALYYYFNEFFDNEAKSKDIVDDYVDDYLVNKPKGLENIYTLIDDIEYEEKLFENYMKMYKNNFQNKENLLKSLFNNPFTFESSYIDNFINVIHTDRQFKIGTTIPDDLKTTETLQLYKTSLNESLYSKLHQIPEEINSNIPLTFKDNDFDYVNDMMRRYGKNIENMTDEEYNKIPKLADKKEKTIKPTVLNVENIVFWDDNINKYIIDNLENYKEEDIISILNYLSEKNLNLPKATDIFNNITDLYKNIADNSIDIEDVYKNANDYLKKIEIERLIESFIALKNNKDTEIIEVKNICNTIDKVFKNEYKFSKEFIEIIDNEDENNIDDNYIELGNVLKPNIEIKQIDQNNKNIFLKALINELGKDLKIDLDLMIEYMQLFNDTEKTESALFYLYITIQSNFYNNNYDDITLCEQCIDIFYEFTEPITIIDGKVVFPKSKSIYGYIICCFKNITDNEYFTTEKDIEKKLSKLIKSNPRCRDQLDELKTLYDNIEDTLEKTDTKFYTNLVKQLRKSNESNNDVKYINFVNALKYIVPKKLKKVNPFIAGCCAQLLNQDYEAYKDITSNNDKWFEDIKYSLINNTINYENTWDAKNYLPEEINQQSIENFDYEEEDNIDDYNIEIDDPEINEYLKDQNKLNKYVEDSVNSFMANVSTKTELFSLKNYILEKCKIVQNLKHLLLAGCLKDSTYYYEQIATLENSCCNDSNFKKRRSNMYVYLGAKYLRNFNSLENNEIYEKIKALGTKVILTREQYNKSISNYREKLKVEAIDILEGLDAEYKEVAIMLKQNGIINAYEDYDTNNTDTNKDPTVNYQGDDNNDQALY
tara:strand:+ start:16468 stop:19017 length:2550 start_codon:yes stop_codon:yes gene_type:complete